MPWKNGVGRTSVAQWKRLRRLAREALDYRCQDCGGEGSLQLDHIVPVAEGGADTLDNLQWLCPECHRQKTLGEIRRGHARRVSRLKRPHANRNPGDSKPHAHR